MLGIFVLRGEGGPGSKNFLPPFLKYFVALLMKDQNLFTEFKKLYCTGCRDIACQSWVLKVLSGFTIGKSIFLGPKISLCSYLLFRFWVFRLSFLVLKVPYDGKKFYGSGLLIFALFRIFGPFCRTKANFF